MAGNATTSTSALRRLPVAERAALARTSDDPQTLGVLADDRSRRVTDALGERADTLPGDARAALARTNARALTSGASTLADEEVAALADHAPTDLLARDDVPVAVLRRIADGDDPDAVVAAVTHPHWDDDDAVAALLHGTADRAARTGDLGVVGVGLAHSLLTRPSDRMGGPLGDAVLRLSDAIAPVPDRFDMGRAVERDVYEESLAGVPPAEMLRCVAAQDPARAADIVALEALVRARLVPDPEALRLLTAPAAFGNFRPFPFDKAGLRDFDGVAAGAANLLAATADRDRDRDPLLARARRAIARDGTDRVVLCDWLEYKVAATPDSVVGWARHQATSNVWMTASRLRSAGTATEWDAGEPDELAMVCASEQVPTSRRGIVETTFTWPVPIDGVYVVGTRGTRRFGFARHGDRVAAVDLDADG